MGWSSTNKPRGMTIKQFFSQEFNSTNGNKIIDCAVVNRNTAYIAYKLKNGDVVGIVCCCDGYVVFC